MAEIEEQDCGLTIAPASGRRKRAPAAPEAEEDGDEGMKRLRAGSRQPVQLRSAASTAKKLAQAEEIAADPGSGL